MALATAPTPHPCFGPPVLLPHERTYKEGGLLFKCPCQPSFSSLVSRAAAVLCFNHCRSPVPGRLTTSAAGFLWFRRCASTPTHLTASRSPCAGRGALPYAGAALGPARSPSSSEHCPVGVTPPPRPPLGELLRRPRSILLFVLRLALDAALVVQD
jgi:hypothetical protein